MTKGKDPPVAGCVSPINIRKTVSTKKGGARLGDYMEQEMRMRHERERGDSQVDTRVTPSRFKETVVSPRDILDEYKLELLEKLQR